MNWNYPLLRKGEFYLIVLFAGILALYLAWLNHLNKEPPVKQDSIKDTFGDRPRLKLHVVDRESDMVRSGDSILFVEKDMILKDSQQPEPEQFSRINRMNIYVITGTNTTDFPGLYTVRRHVIGAGTVTPDRIIGHAKTLEEARKLVPPGLSRIDRDQSDDPVILECWL